MRLTTSLALLLALGLCAPAAAAPRQHYYKMVHTEDAATMKPGQLLRPRFSKTLLRDGHPVLLGHGSSDNGGVAERLFKETLERLREDGKVDRDAPGRTEGVFVAADLDRFPRFRDDPTRSRVTLRPSSPRKVATYDRRHFLAAIRALDRADRATRPADRARHLARAQREAERYYLEPADPSDPKAEPETLLGGGGEVVRVSLRR